MASLAMRMAQISMRNNLQTVLAGMLKSVHWKGPFISHRYSRQENHTNVFNSFLILRHDKENEYICTTQKNICE